MNILLVDDEPDVRRSLSNFLVKLGHTVTCAKDGIEGLREFHSNSFDLVITDIRMPSMSGIELMRRIKEIERSPADIIIITGHGDMENAIRALKYGAYDYLQKPINVRELAISIERSAEYRNLRNSYASLKEEFQERIAIETRTYQGKAERLREAYLREIGLGELCIYSEAMRQVVDSAEHYSMDRAVPVLIEGETGTGKELVARFIHYYGQDSATKPFVAINCGAMPRDLVESELFGHERGAYTGALSDQMGKLEMAQGGTIFLDEIGEMPYGLQVKLLRVLEERKLYRIGGTKEIPLDLRFISATNKDLQLEVDAKRFRLDLYYRINMGAIRIPPLRERKEDILPLALRFVRQSAARRGKTFGEFTLEAQELLVSLPWRGNVRELKNVMERLALFGPWDQVEARDLLFVENVAPEEDQGTGIKPIIGVDEYAIPEGKLDLEGLNREIVKRALDRHHGNRTQTALYLGISRRVLQGKLKKLGLLRYP